MNTYEEVKQFVVFKLDNQLYGIDIQSVQIIERIKGIMRVPKTSSWVKGVLNLRGEIIPVLDTRVFFASEPKEGDDNTRIIIVKLVDTMVGLIVDSVKEVVEIDDNDIEVAPTVQGKINSNYIQGVVKIENDEDIVTLLHLEMIIEEAFQIQK